MVQKILSTILTELRTARGLTVEALSELSGVSHSTIRIAERDASPTRDSTLRQILTGMARVGAFTTEEITEITEALRWTPEALRYINRSAVPVTVAKPDGRSTARSRVISVLDEHGDLAEPLADVIESIARLLTASKAAQMPQQRPRSQPEQLAALLKSLAPGTAELAPLPAPDPIPNPQSPMPSPTDRLSTTRKVVLPAEQTKDGTVIQRFEYYTEDGRRLIPAPPKARKLDRDEKTG